MGKIKVIYDGQITIENPPAPLVKQIKKKLRLRNPAYYPAIRKNPKAKYAVSEFFEYYSLDDSGVPTLHLPRGLRRRVDSYFDRANHETTFVDNQATVSSGAIQSNIDLRDYQKPVYEDIDSSEYPQGILNLSTGFGKTVIAIQLICDLKQKALIVAPKLDIVEQFIESIKEFTDRTPGLIQGDNHDIKDITVASAQTLANRLEEIKPDTFGVMLIDEVHEFITDTRKDILNHFSAKYRYGLTGTNERTDGQGDAIEWYMGPTIVKDIRTKVEPTVHVYEHAEHIWQQEYHDMVKQKIALPGRNLLIADIIEEYAKHGHNTLVLVKRLDHIKEIRAKLSDSLPEDAIHQVDAQTSTDEREAIYDKFRREDADGPAGYVLFGTYALLSTGVDLPSASCCVLAGDLKSSVLTKQSVGRILRVFDGKETPVIVDIHDSNNKTFHSQHLSRKRVYEKKGWEVVNKN